MMNNKKVLWLASWYPGEYEHTNGDFVQRHAWAVARYIKLDVIHVAQAGAEVFTEQNTTITKEGQLTEYNYSFNHKPIRITLLNKIIYNVRFITFYKRILKQYIKDNGIPDIVHVHAPMKAGLLALWLKKKYNLPYIVTEHSSMYDPTATDSFYTRSTFFKKNTAKVFQGATIVTCVSETVGGILKNLFNLQQLKIIHNVVQTNLFLPVESRNNQDETFIWVHVSSLNSRKNVEGIIEAFYKLNNTVSNWKLNLVGPVRDSLVKLVKDVNLTDKITFLGELSYDMVAKEVAVADALILFSRQENYPCVISEAFCCGIPVVSSDVGGIHEAINSDNGILVPSENVEVLAHSIALLPFLFSDKSLLPYLTYKLIFPVSFVQYHSLIFLVISIVLRSPVCLSVKDLSFFGA